MSSKWYILNEQHEAIPAGDGIAELAAWFETAVRHVAKDDIGEVTVSTVFLGLDHNFFKSDEPHLFETMIFGGPHDGYQDRCATWDQAIKQHAEAVALVKA